MEIVNVFLDVKIITGDINIWSENEAQQFRLTLRSTYWVSYGSTNEKFSNIIYGIIKVFR